MGMLPAPRLPRRGLLLSAPLLALPYVPRKVAAAPNAPILDEPMQRFVGGPTCRACCLACSVTAGLAHRC